MPNNHDKIILFEYDKPVDLADTLPIESGVFGWRVYNTTTSYTDDYGVTGYYSYVQPVKWQIRSVKVGGLDYAKVSTLANLRITDNAFMYDVDSGILAIHRAGGEPMLSEDVIYGVSQGFSMNADDPYFAGFFYEPRLNKVPAIKKSIDAEFFGLLKYQSFSPGFINNDGYFDNWRDLNLFGQRARILIGDPDDAYEDFITVFDGFIEDDSRDFGSFSVTIQDPRKGLTQPIATNTLSLSLYPNIDDQTKGQTLPVAYGSINNAKAYCTNGNGSPSTYNFKICDTTYNSVVSISKVLVDGVDKTSYITYNLSGGGFSLSSSHVSSSTYNNVTVSFVASSIAGSVAILKDLMYRYNGTSFISDFWDTTEVTAIAPWRTTSLYIDDDSPLSDAVQKVCVDGDLRFFQHDDGRYTIRQYSSSRAVAYTINKEDWINAPSIKNSGSNYLSSVTLNYAHNIENDTWLTYTNTSYEAAAYNRYKKLKSKTIETGLTTEANAISKSNTIMEWSSNVQDIVERQVCWDKGYQIEITDFVWCDPYRRESGTENKAVYEVLGVQKNIEKLSVTLSVRFVRSNY